MLAKDKQSNVHKACLPRGWNQLAIGVLWLGMSNQVAWSQDADAADPVERSMYFIERSAEATDLFNANQPQEALAILQDLDANHADLDEDGYVAMTIGDCLAILGRDPEARAAYQAAAASHPDLEAKVAQRLIELELAGSASDALIEELRFAAYSQEAEDENRFIASWRLGRALQGRAKTLLDEAAGAFRAAADSGLGQGFPYPVAILNHATVLEELAEDLTFLVERAGKRWGSARRPAPVRSCSEGQWSPSDLVTERQRSERLLRTRDGRRIEVQIRHDEQKGEMEITANHRPIKLTATQKLLIRRHQERINAILLEAAGQTGE